MNERFIYRDTAIPDLRIVETKRLGDDRGFLERLFCAEELIATGWRKPIAQINRTKTLRRGTVRGLHFQHPPHSEMKFVICLRGKVFDVAVDLRAGSPALLKFHTLILTEDTPLALLVPEGFAHGFQALTDDVEMLYLHSLPYVAASEGGICPTDARLGIAWPLEISEISARDANHPRLDVSFTGVKL
jgi:dTDP-4-dehydrorhamnose 3,5-epimerase